MDQKIVISKKDIKEQSSYRSIPILDVQGVGLVVQAGDNNYPVNSLGEATALIDSIYANAAHRVLNA